MDMSISDTGAACKISMLWNWYTIDACFLASSWHVRSKGAFAVSCIGVALLVVVLELLRRLGKEYDAVLYRRFHQNAIDQYGERNSNGSFRLNTGSPAVVTIRADPVQQLIRAVIHMVTFGVAYIIMLLAMYFNGYIIISIFIGAFLGKFLGDWLEYKVSMTSLGSDKSASGGIDEPTVCCG